MQQTELRNKILSLTSQLDIKTSLALQWKAQHVRMYSIFGKSSLFTVESEYCGREVAAVDSAARCSAVSQQLLQFILQKLMQGKVTLPGQRLSISTFNLDVESNEISPIKSSSSKELKLEIQTVLIRQVLILLKATCLSWQCAGVVLSGSKGLDIDAGLSLIGTTLNSLIEIVQLSVERQLVEGTQSLSGVIDDKVSADIEDVILQAEKLLEPSFESFGLCALPSIPSLQAGRKGSISIPSKHLLISPIVTDDTLTEADNSLRRFHLSCQSSYLTIGSDLLAAFVHSRTTSTAPFGAITQSPLSSPLTSSTRLSTDDDSYTESSKSGNYVSSSNSNTHHGAVVDLCRTIRTDLDSCGLLTPRGMLTVSMRTSTSPRKEDRKEDSSGQSKEINESGCFTPSDVINVNLSTCFNQLLDIVLNSHSHGSGIEEINASPAQLRVCLTKISLIKSMLTQHNSTTSHMSPPKISDQINVVNLASSDDIDNLWEALTMISKNENSDSDSSHQVRKWDDFSPWRVRVKFQKDQLEQWESSQGELLTLRGSLLGIQKELQTRVDELKAAKAANQELNQLMQQSASVSPTGREMSSSSSSRSNQGDVSKLKTEIEVKIIKHPYLLLLLLQKLYLILLFDVVEICCAFINFVAND